MVLRLAMLYFKEYWETCPPSHGFGCAHSCSCFFELALGVKVSRRVAYSTCSNDQFPADSTSVSLVAKQSGIATRDFALSYSSKRRYSLNLSSQTDPSNPESILSQQMFPHTRKDCPSENRRSCISNLLPEPPAC